MAYFGRPSDPSGLANFAAALQAAGAPTNVAGLATAYASDPAVKSLIDSFGTSKESQTLYGGGTTTAFVTAVFQNVLGRAPQSAGLSFWVGAIDNGSVSPGDAALSIMAGALANTTAQGLLHAQLVNNRLSAAGFFTGAASPATYTGTAAAANARAMLATIKATTTADALQSAAVTDAQAFNNQTIFESTALHSGEWNIGDNIPYGGVLVPGTNYVYAAVNFELSASPAGGAQQATTRYSTLDSALAVTGYSVTRVLVNGQVMVRPSTGLRSVSYLGNGINVQYYDSTGQTVVTITHLDNYQSGTLSRQMSQAQEIVQASVPINQWVGYQIFSATANWQAGSSYTTHSAQGVGDLYVLFDCQNVASPTTTYGTTPTPCASNATLASIFPISQYSGSIGKPNEIDNAGDGRFVTVQGLPMWIANNPMSLVQGGQTQVYRTYVQLNGNVYYGSLSKDGTTVYTHQADGTYVDYSLALNESAASSVSQGLITGSGQGSRVGTGTADPDTTEMFGIGGSGINGALSPADLRAHYNVPATLTGAGQTVAIIDAPSGGNVEEDLAAYSAYYNLPPCTTANGCLIQYTFPPSGTITNYWGAESDIDVQMVHAIAPGAKILFVTAASNSVSDLFTAVQYALTQPGVTAVSMSFSGPGIGQTSNADFLTAATTGGTAADWSNTSWMNTVQPQSILAGQREVKGLGSPNVANMMAYLGGKAPSVAAVKTVEIEKLGRPADRMTRVMLRGQIADLRAKRMPAQKLIQRN